MRTASNDNWPSNGWPRGMRRAVAAAYLGISPSHFDGQRRAGAIPAPRRMFGVEIYDRSDLDGLFLESGDLPVSAATDTDYWDIQCDVNGSQNS